MTSLGSGKRPFRYKRIQPYRTDLQEVSGPIRIKLKSYFRGKLFTSPVPDLPIGYIGLSLGPQDPRGPPTNCGTH